MIRKCYSADFNIIYEVINSAAIVYKGNIPADRWHEPYMGKNELAAEIENGVVFWCFTEKEQIIGVMGIQDIKNVTLIRHAYVLPAFQNRGIGSRLLRHLESLAMGPLLIGTWADAKWAIKFYEKHGFKLVTEEEKNSLLRKYWHIPERQVETSVVLSNTKVKNLLS